MEREVELHELLSLVLQQKMGRFTPGVWAPGTLSTCHWASLEVTEKKTANILKNRKHVVQPLQ